MRTWVRSLRSRGWIAASLVLCVAAVAAAAWLSSLERRLDAWFQTVGTAPSRLYARSLVLRRGMDPVRAGLSTQLARTGHRLVKGPDVSSGEFAVRPGQWRIGLRSFRHAEGEEAGGPLRVELDAEGRITNPDEAIGEIVNTAGVGKFEGYYKNEEATRERTRGGMYWSGDFGYRDRAGYLYFTGRALDWIRVDGENFLAKPIEDALQRHPKIYLVSVYGVADASAGDRVMATIVVADDFEIDGAELYEFLVSQPDFSPKWLPTRVKSEMPTTPSPSTSQIDSHIPRHLDLASCSA